MPNDRDELAPEFERFRAKRPGDEGRWVFHPIEGLRYQPGDVVPTIGLEFAVRPDGLAIPARSARPPAPADLIRVYLTGEEVFGRRIGLQYVASAFRRLEISAGLISSARLLARYEGLDIDHRAVDLDLARSWFKEPTRTRVIQEIEQGRALVTPQSILLMMKLALLLSPAEAEPDESIKVPILVLALQDALGSEQDSDEPNVFRGEVQRPLFRTIIQSQAFGMRTEPATLLARHRLRWHELPQALADRHDAVDLPATFEQATGVPLDDVAAVAMVLWAAAVQNHLLPFNIATAGLKWNRDRLDRALALLSATPEVLGETTRKLDEIYGVQWSFDAFRQFPIVRLTDDLMLVLSPDMLLERAFGWLPLFDLKEGLRQSGETKRAARAETFFRAVTEAEAMECIRSLAPTAGVRRLYEEAEIQAAFGTTRKNADGTLEYADAFVVIEVSTRPLTRKSVVGGSPEALEDDLAKGIDQKVEQIDETIRRLIEDEGRLTGRAALPRRRYVAVLVVTEGFPVNPMTVTAIAERLSRKGLLEDPRIGPLHVLDQEELYMIEGLTHAGGASMLELLEEHERASLFRMAFKDWLLMEKRVRPPRSPRVSKPFNRAWAPAIRSLTGEDLALDDDDEPA